MKNLAILLCFLGALTPAFAQKNAAQAIIDSLEKVIETTDEDSTKARSLGRLSNELRIAGEMEAALSMGEAGVKLASEADDKKGEAGCLSNVGLIYYTLGNYARALGYYQKSLEIYKQIGDYMAQPMLLVNIGLIYRNQGDYARAISYSRQSLKIREEIGDRSGQAKSLNLIGGIYAEQGDYAKGLEYYQKSLEIRDETGDRHIQAVSLINIGIIYAHQGEFSRALDNYQKSLQIFKETGDRNGQANTLNNIASIYYYQGDDARALDYYKQSLKISEDINDRREYATALGNIGGIYAEQGDDARALDHFKQSLKISEEIGDRKNQGSSQVKIGVIYSNLNDYARALDYYQKSLQIRNEIGDLSGQAHSLANIAALKVLTNQAAEARSLARQALEIATEVGALYWMEHAAEVSAKADSALGDWKSAYEHYKLFKQYGDSLKNDAQSKEIGRLESKYEFDKEIEERERQEAEAAERRQKLYWIAVGVFAALLLVAGLLTWGFRTKQKANKQLTAQNEEIRAQSEEISQQRDELQTLNERLAEQKAEVEQARDEIAEQHEQLEKAHEEITDSIDYASRIQRALLPAETTLQKGAEAYVYYKPRDVVSGDFYWMNHLDEDTALYSAADCTGHGVPGAFMSVLGATTLDTIVREYGETRPDQMLKLLDQSIRASLKQDDAKDGSLDGMDLALIKLDKKNRKLYFSSAGRPLFLLRNGEILEYKGAKFPAGGAQHGDKEFPLIEIDLEPGDRIFMCSDGVTDQFGGPRKRKFSPKRLKETLLAHQDKDLQTQGAAFAAAFDDWQKSAKQLDDQLLLALAA